MPDRREVSGDTDRLIQLMCDGIASESDRKVLGDAMLRDPRVLERYVDAIHLCVELPEFTAGPIRETEHLKTDGSYDAADEQRSTLAGSRANRWFFVGAIAIAATLLVGVTIMFGARSGGSVATMKTSQDNQQPSNNRSASPAPSDSDYVARVIYESPDLQWIGGEAPTDFLLRLPAEQVLSISRGVLEIEFHSQARVILQAPATFVPLGRDSGRLVDGRLTGRAETPGFLLEAGSVNVVDLGTEFGVVVDEHSGTDTHVFDGEVEVQLDPTDTSGEKMLLREGMSASVDAGGTPKTAEDSIAGRFIRNASPSRRADELSGRLTLIDLISGSTGFEQRFAGAINPNTGAWDLENPLYRDDGHKGDRLGDGSFHPATYSDFVDGTFAPAVGQDKIRIDSAGSLCDVGAIDGEHYGPIWVRRKSSLDQSVSFNADFWGTDTLRLILDQLSNAREGIMGVHPNAGITIDVSRIRDRLGVTPTRFEATSINLEKVISRGRNKTADLRVLCDGKVSYSRVGFGAMDGPERVSVEIAEDTRFLTIFSTDGGDRITYDHVVLIDPLFLFH